MSISFSEIVGRQVVYRAGHPGAEPEHGEVTSANSSVVFVRFNGSTSQACTPSDLHFLDGKPVDQRSDEQARKKYDNGRPLYSWTGTMLDQNGNRSIFDDVDTAGSLT